MPHLFYPDLFILSELTPVIPAVVTNGGYDRFYSKGVAWPLNTPLSFIGLANKIIHKLIQLMHVFIAIALYLL